jgi:poly(hydroxyalkanoate) granule-associated protein
MAEKVKVKVEEESEEAQRSPLYEASRKVLLASIGAVALAQEEMEEFVNRLVERGELAEKDGKKLVREMMERRRKGAQKAEEVMDKRVEDLLSRMNIPSKSDIDALSARVAALTKKVEELKTEEHKGE